MWFSPWKIFCWWSGTCFYFFHILGRIIPTGFHIFQRGWNHQPDMVLTHTYIIALGHWRYSHGDRSNNGCHQLRHRSASASQWTAARFATATLPSSKQPSHSNWWDWSRRLPSMPAAARHGAIFETWPHWLWLEPSARSMHVNQDLRHLRAAHQLDGIELQVIFNRLFKKDSKGEFLMCHNSPEFQSWKKNLDSTWASKSTHGVPYSIMLWQVFQGNEQAMGTALTRGNIFEQDGMWHHAKVSAGRTKTTTDGMELQGGSVKLKTDEFAEMSQWFSSRAWSSWPCQ